MQSSYKWSKNKEKTILYTYCMMYISPKNLCIQVRVAAKTPMPNTAVPVSVCCLLCPARQPAYLRCKAYSASYYNQFCFSSQIRCSFMIYIKMSVFWTPVWI